jgi:hypothetical protein
MSMELEAAFVCLICLITAVGALFTKQGKLKEFFACAAVGAPYGALIAYLITYICGS